MTSTIQNNSQAGAMREPGYEKLAAVLQRAYDQASKGKGKERHADGEPFHEQVMQIGARKFGVGSLLFQAFKKSEESQRLPLDRGVAELLGAIVYLAGAVIAREAEGEPVMEVTGTGEPVRVIPTEWPISSPVKCCNQPHDCSDVGCAKRAQAMADTPGVDGWMSAVGLDMLDIGSLGRRMVEIRGRDGESDEFSSAGPADMLRWSGVTHYRLLP